MFIEKGIKRSNKSFLVIYERIFELVIVYGGNLYIEGELVRQMVESIPYFSVNVVRVFLPSPKFYAGGVMSLGPIISCNPYEAVGSVKINGLPFPYSIQGTYCIAQFFGLWVEVGSINAMGEIKLNDKFIDFLK